MYRLFTNIASLVTVDTSGVNFLRGNNLNDYPILQNYSIVTNNGIIEQIVNQDELSYFFRSNKPYEIIDLSGKTVLPGFVECHSHLVFAGNRRNDFKLRINGADYEEIAKQGGGINLTRNAVKNTPFEELCKIALKRVDSLISQGITTLEIKSGYGLDYENELKMLSVIRYLNTVSPINIIATFLGAHTYPTEYKSNKQAYLKSIIEEMIPAVAENNLALHCDGFCEPTAFSPDELDTVFTAAQKHGLRIKLHTEQFNSIGGLELALKFNADSVDHLEVITDEGINLLSDSETVAVLLPGVSYFLEHNYAPARKLIDSNAIVALAGDFNPGSSHILNLPLIFSQALFEYKMSPKEIIAAYTINSAKALHQSINIGSIEIGKSADFAIFDTDDYIDIFYNCGSNLNIATVKSGNIIYEKA